MSTDTTETADTLLTDEKFTDINTELESLLRKLAALDFGKSESDDDDDEPLDRISLRVRLARELRESSDNHLVKALLENEVLTRRHFVKESTGNEFPIQVFCMQYISGKLTAGELLTCSLHNEETVKITVESFRGVSLEVLLDDMEPDGFIEVTS